GHDQSVDGHHAQHDAQHDVGSAANSDRSRPAPTDTKNNPRSSPWNGSTVFSIRLRCSVSASKRPAMNAPSAMDIPAAAAARPAPVTTRSDAATNNSSLSARATDRI